MLKSGFFNSIDGDRKYNADDFADYFEGILTDGIYASVGTCFQCFISTDNTILVGTGRAKLLNRYIRNTTDFEVQLDAADAQYDRIDTICLKVDKANSGERAGSIVAIKGTPSASPKYPKIPENTEDVAYLRIASFRVAKNDASISQYARHVGETGTPYVQIDKSIHVEAQYKAFEEAYAKMITDMEQYESSAQKEFSDWFASVSGQLTNWSIQQETLNYATVGGGTQEVTLQHMVEMRLEYVNSTDSGATSAPIRLKIPTAPPADFHAKAVLHGFSAFAVDGATNLSGFQNHASLSVDMPVIGGHTVGIDVFFDGFGYRFNWYDANAETA